MVIKIEILNASENIYQHNNTIIYSISYPMYSPNPLI